MCPLCSLTTPCSALYLKFFSHYHTNNSEARACHQPFCETWCCLWLIPAWDKDGAGGAAVPLGPGQTLTEGCSGGSVPEP